MSEGVLDEKGRKSENKRVSSFVLHPPLPRSLGHVLYPTLSIMSFPKKVSSEDYFAVECLFGKIPFVHHTITLVPYRQSKEPECF